MNFGLVWIFTARVLKGKFTVVGLINDGGSIYSTLIQESSYQINTKNPSQIIEQTKPWTNKSKEIRKK